jgi:hypothetical protein
MVTPMKEKYQKYWKKMDKFAAINIVFDPRCKLELINFLISDKLSTEAAAASLKQIKSNIYSWFDDLARCQAPPTEETDIVRPSQLVEGQFPPISYSGKDGKDHPHDSNDLNRIRIGVFNWG